MCEGGHRLVGQLRAAQRGRVIAPAGLSPAVAESLSKSPDESQMVGAVVGALAYDRNHVGNLEDDFLAARSCSAYDAAGHP